MWTVSTNRRPSVIPKVKGKGGTVGGGGVGSTTLHTTATSSGPPVKVRALLGLCERRSFVKNCSQILDCVPQRALQVNLSLATG